MYVHEVCQAQERLAPLSFAEAWDNVGLLMGSRQAPVSRLLLTLDITSEALQLADRLGSEMILSHHPLLFHPVKRILMEEAQGRLLQHCLGKKLAIYAAHTNLDACLGGVNDALAAALELHPISTLLPLGEPEQLLQAALLEHHPLYPEAGAKEKEILPGFGRIALPGEEELHAKTFVRRLNNNLQGTGCLVNFDKDKTYRKILLWGGAFDGEQAIPACVEQGIDCVVAGEIKHHDLIHLAELDIHAIAAGHDVTERTVLGPWMSYLQKTLPDCRVAIYTGLSYNNLVY